MIMEHFEVHKEQLEDLIVDMQKQGPKVFMDLPAKEKNYMITIDDMALIDEISGLNHFVEGVINMSDAPETVK